jgi:HK97 family phage major capsid protein/HK97 family phage prohead protease
MVLIPLPHTAYDLRDIAGQELRRFEPTEFRAQDEERTIEFPFSSELPVARWFGEEILDHSLEAVNLSRMNDGAPLLFNHDPDRVIGVVERAWVDEEKRRGMARVRFSRNDFAQQVLADITDGILRNVSVGYAIGDAENRGDSIVATSWEPHEVSVVSIPADPTVGIGRSLDAGAPAPANTPTPSPMMDENTPNLDEVRAQAMAEERARVASITDLCRTHKVEDKAQNFIERGASVTEAQAEVLAELAQRAKAPQHAAPAQRAVPIAGAAPMSADIGMSDKEIRSYSFLRAMRAQLMPNDPTVREDAGFEREVSQAVAQRMGISPKGMLIAHDVLSARTLTAGTAATAGNLVFPDARPESFIELLRKRNVLTSLGVQMLTGLVGPVPIPRQTGAATAYWVGEAVEATESEMTVDQVNLTPKNLSAWTRFSRLLMMQSSLDVETLVRQDLVTVMALEIARASLYGTGSSSQPEGLKFITGINTEDFAAAQPTYAELVSMETKIAADDADIAAMGYATNATVFGGFKTTEKAANTAQFVLEPGGTVNSYGVVRSNQVESGDVFMGVWNQMLIGMWGALDLQVNPYSEDKAGNIRVVTHQSCDVAVRHPESFCRGNNTL